MLFGGEVTGASLVAYFEACERERERERGRGRHVWLEEKEFLKFSNRVSVNKREEKLTRIADVSK